MTRLLYGDLETFSTEPIKSGTAKYAEPAEVMLHPYAIDDEPVRDWDRTTGEPMPADLADAYADPETLFVFHNSWFDRTVMEISEYGLIYQIPPIPRWRCTMAQALAHSLPGKLETLGAVFGLDEDKRKTKDGKALIQLFCKPRPAKQKLRRATRESHPEEWARFVEYARQDVETMRVIHRKLPTWNYGGSTVAPNGEPWMDAGRRELELWFLDQKINSRGFQVDLDLAHAAIRASDRAKDGLAEDTQRMTGYNAETGEGVEAATQRDKLLKYILEAHGVDLPDMKADTLERRIDDPELPEAVKDLLRVRLSSSKTTATKYKRFVQCTSSDGRMRGTMQFAGASRTARFAHRLVQPGNFMRPDMKAADVEFGIQCMKDDAEDLLYDDVMRLCGNAVRGTIIAPKGKKLVVADLSNIEGRDAAWLAGETWKLQAFRDFDTFVLDGGGGNKIPDGKGDFLRKGHDLYKLSYARSFQIDPTDVVGWMRQIGKVLELALQFQGGVGAFLTMAATYGLDIAAMTIAAWDSIPDEIKAEARGFLRWLYDKELKKHLKRMQKGVDETISLTLLEEDRIKVRFGLTEDQFVACDSLKRLWRGNHPGMADRDTGMWNLIRNAMANAIRNPGKVFQAGAHLKVDKFKAWLRVQLPSGRYLSYPSPQLSKDGQISYMGVNQYNRKWQRIRTYGGKAFENVVQGVARDVMTHNMPAIESWLAAA